MNSKNIGWARMICSFRYVAALGLLLLLWGMPRVARAQNECKAAFEANDKLLTTPHHGFITRSAVSKADKPELMENIFVGGVYYVQIRGKWVKSPMTAEQMKQQQEENRKNAKNVSCKHVRDEPVNGEAAAVYKVHSETEDTKADAQIWISNSKGLILRQEEDLDLGGDKMHVVTRFEYGNITAPKVSP
jgi:cytochrome c556